MSLGSDSLLSSISNVSVLIKHGDGSSVFNLSLLPNNNQNPQGEQPCEVKLQDIFPFEYSHHNSILDPIIKQEYHPQSYPAHSPQHAEPTFNQHSWTITQLKGVSEDEQSLGEQERQEALQKKNKNETKNIPKNYGKAIITFIEKYKDVVKDVCQSVGVRVQDFVLQIGEAKKRINTIADLRYLWMEYKYSKCMRILSNLFLRKYSLNYIFNSRICNYRSHIKYRHRLAEAVSNPKVFRHIKDY